MSLIQRLDPREGFVDFWHEFRRPNPYRWPILGLSALITTTLFYSFVQERSYAPPPRPEVEFITTFPDGRTDAEIMAENEANQAFQDVVDEQMAEKEERKREMFRTLGRATGMDVDEIDRRAEENRAREEAERAAQVERMLAGRQAQVEPAGE